MKILALVFTIIFTFIPLSANSEEIPNLVGKKYNEVKDKIISTGLGEVIEYTESDQAIGTILVQIPTAGTSINGQNNIFMRVSNGVVVPDLKLLTKEDAQSILKKLNVGLEYIEEQVLGFQKGIVAKQVPIKDTRIDATKDIVYLQISNDSGVEIPHLIGKSHVEAKENLESIGLVGAENPPNPKLFHDGGLCTSSFVYKAEVISTSPQKGTYVKKGETITINYKIVLVNSWRGGPCTEDGNPY